MVCSLTIKTAPIILQALGNAFYKGIVDADLDEIPLATENLDVFNVKSHELGQVLSNKVIFNEAGLLVYKNDGSGS